MIFCINHKINDSHFQTHFTPNKQCSQYICYKNLPQSLILNILP